MVCLVLLLGYDWVVVYLLPAGLRTGDSQWSDNIIRAQRFIYEERDARVVIVGSSLSSRLVDALLPGGVTNLSLGGMSPQDGLRLLARSGAAPQLVMVEANYLPLAERGEFSEGLFRAGVLQARRHLPALRDKNRPISVMGALLGLVARRLAGRPTEASLVEMHERSGPALGAGPDPGKAGDVFDKLLEAERQGHAHAVPPELLTSARQNVERLLKTLSGRGSRVAFFLLPTHPDICNSPRVKSARDLVSGSFSEHPYIELGNCRSVTTTDGKHLDPASARVVTRELVNRLPGLLDAPASRAR